MNAIVVKLTYAEMEQYLNNPATRIVDSRMLEGYDNFSFTFQVLNLDGTISSVEVEPKLVQIDNRTRVNDLPQFRKEALDLFRLQYRNNPRNNPGLYGLLDGVENNVE